jgi:hypothetical protein
MLDLPMAAAHWAVVAVTAVPDPTGLPGGAAMQRLLNGGVFLGLLLCAGAVVLGGATWIAGSRTGNYSAGYSGRTACLAGVLGALVIGAAAALVNFFYAVGGTVS